MIETPHDSMIEQILNIDHLRQPRRASSCRGSVAICEDELLIGLEIEHALRSCGFAIAGVAADTQELLEIISLVPTDIVVLDIMLRGTSTGIDVAEKIQLEHKIPVVFVTGHSDKSTLDAVFRTRPFGYVPKPFDARTLEITLEIALLRHRAELALQERARTGVDLLFHLGQGLIVLDQRGYSLMVNDCAAEILEYDPSSPSAHWTNLFQPVPHDRASAAMQLLSRVIDGHGTPSSVSGTSLVKSSVGNLKQVSWSLTSLRTELPDPIGSALILNETRSP